MQTLRERGPRPGQRPPLELAVLLLVAAMLLLMAAVQLKELPFPAASIH